MVKDNKAFRDSINSIVFVCADDKKIESTKLLFKLKLAKLEIVSISSFKQNLSHYLEKEYYVLIDTALLNEIDSFNSYNIRWDLLKLWINPQISVSDLRSIHCDDYTDICGNRILVSRETPSSTFIIREISNGICAATNNFIRLGNYKNISSDVRISITGNKGYYRIGHNTTIKGMFICGGGGGKVIIGNDCMMARNITLWANDGHCIFERDTGRRINYHKGIVIGNHVWLGKDVTLLDGCSIPDGCVVGYGSVTSHTFAESNSIIAGNPAKIIRHNVCWSREVQNDNIHSLADCDVGNLY